MEDLTLFIVIPRNKFNNSMYLIQYQFVLNKVYTIYIIVFFVITIWRFTKVSLYSWTFYYENFNLDNFYAFLCFVVFFHIQSYLVKSTETLNLSAACAIAAQITAVSPGFGTLLNKAVVLPQRNPVKN